MPTRSDHIAWCKKRALEYLSAGEIPKAYASLASDLARHEKTKDHPAILFGAQLMVTGNLSTLQEMKDFIEGTK